MENIEVKRQKGKGKNETKSGVSPEGLFEKTKPKAGLRPEIRSTKL